MLLWAKADLNKTVTLMASIDESVNAEFQINDAFDTTTKRTACHYLISSTVTVPQKSAEVPGKVLSYFIEGG